MTSFKPTCLGGVRIGAPAPVRMVTLLLEHRAQVCPRHAKGLSAVHAPMTFGGHTEVLGLLLRQDPGALGSKDERNGHTHRWKTRLPQVTGKS